MEILYEVHDNLYVNLTNRCPCACTFCLRQNTDHVGASGRLWLAREPSADEVIAAFAAFDLSRYESVVFCGFGEPTEALAVLLPVADWLKRTHPMPIRLNTNGLGALVNGRDIAPELRGRVDAVSISLNTSDPARYHALVRSRYGAQSFDAMLAFARACVAAGLHVVMTTVDTTIDHDDERACAALCAEIGADYRIRPYEG